jgi:hypothetical protein
MLMYVCLFMELFECWYVFTYLWWSAYVSVECMCKCVQEVRCQPLVLFLWYPPPWLTQSLLIWLQWLTRKPRDSPLSTTWGLWLQAHTIITGFFKRRWLLRVQHRSPCLCYKNCIGWAISQILFSIWLWSFLQDVFLLKLEDSSGSLPILVLEISFKKCQRLYDGLHPESLTAGGKATTVQQDTATGLKKHSSQESPDWVEVAFPLLQVRQHGWNVYKQHSSPHMRGSIDRS